MQKVSKLLRNILKVLIIVILLPILFLLFVGLGLYFPPIQKMAKNKIECIATESLGLNVSIGSLYLKFPLTLSVSELLVEQAFQDTVVYLGNFKTQITFAPSLFLVKEFPIDYIDMKEVKFHYEHIEDGIDVRGDIKNLFADNLYASLNTQKIRLGDWTLQEGWITLKMNEVVRKDTIAATPIDWKLDLNRLWVENFSFAYDFKGKDSIYMAATFPQFKLNTVAVDLSTYTATLQNFISESGTLRFERSGFSSHRGRFDMNKIELGDLNLNVHSFSLDTSSVALDLEKISFKESCGFEITSLSGKIHYDTAAVVLDNLKLSTPNSQANVDVCYPLAWLDKANNKSLALIGEVVLSQKDLAFFLPSATYNNLKRIAKNRLLRMSFDLQGDERFLAVNKTKVFFEDLVSLEFRGEVARISDEIRRSGTIDYNFYLSPQGAECLTDLLTGFNQNFRLPAALSFRGKTSLAYRRISSENVLKDGDAQVKFNGFYSLYNEKYEADLKIDSLIPAHFIKNDSLLLIDGVFNLKGQHRELYNPKTFFRLEGMLNAVKWGRTKFHDIQTDISLQDQVLALVFNSDTEGGNLSLILDGILSKEGINAGVRAEINDLDLMKLNLSENFFKTKLTLGGELKSDLKEQYNFIGSVEDFVIKLEEQIIRPKDLTIQAITSSDSIRMVVKSGDLDVRFIGYEGLNKSGEKLSLLLDRAKELFKDTSEINKTSELVPLYPHTSLSIKAGMHNLISTYLKHKGVVFRNLDLDIGTDTIRGLGGAVKVHTLMLDTTRIDSINLKLYQDTLGLHLLADIRKKAYRQQLPFIGNAAISTQLNHLDFDINVYDLNQTPTWKLTAYGKRKQEGFHLKILNDELMIAQNKFLVNKDNYLIFNKDGAFDANLHLQHPTGSEIYLLSNKTGDKHALQLLVDRVELADFKGIIGFEGIGGLFVADIRYLTQKKENTSQIELQAELGIFDFRYHEDRIGDIGLTSTYKPLNAGTHQGEFVLSLDGYELGFAKAMYVSSGKKNQIDGTFTVDDLPLKLFNPFLPDKMVKLDGAFASDLLIKGTMEAPIIDGQIILKKAHAEIPSIGTTIRFEDKPIEFSKGVLNFNQYGIRTTQETPFIVDGSIDLRDLKRMQSNLHLSAKNMQLINARRTRESLAYGRLYVDLDMTLRGPIDALRIRGNASILGNTDFTYVMSDSRLTVQDRMKNLVSFTDFNDTLYIKKKEKEFTLGDMNVLLGIHIDRTAILRADLTPDRESRVEVEGGGDLSFTYRPSASMTLSGKYELLGGKVRYSMPIIPLKLFTIKPGSFIQWTGDLMNPTLNLHAVERTRSSVTMNGEKPRQVNFDVTASILQSLNDLELRFDLDAPEDLSVQNLLASLTPEERSRQALNLMTTGIFMGGASNVNVNTALSSFIQKEFNNLTGTAFEGADFTIGMENYDNRYYGGGNYTDYMFRFSKRFYDDRLKVIVGGRVTSGDAPPQRTQSFVDNIILEFRLNRSGGRLLQLFHKRNYESVLEGEILETGAGVILRRKMRSLPDLWPFNKTKKEKIKSEEER